MSGILLVVFSPAFTQNKAELNYLIQLLWQNAKNHFNHPLPAVPPLKPLLNSSKIKSLWKMLGFSKAECPTTEILVIPSKGLRFIVWHLENVQPRPLLCFQTTSSNSARKNYVVKLLRNHETNNYFIPWEGWKGWKCYTAEAAWLNVCGEQE